MRILAIRGCNLASLAGEFEIDLARAPFSDAGVFAIVGNTGAGKSTLLDALCVALFDRTPRLTNHSRVVVGRGDDDPGALGAQDVRTLLRRGAASGWAEVDFESGDARRYRARWSVRRARGQTDGTLQDQQLTLTAIDGSRERLGGTKTETLKAIVARLGLSFDQFRRSALLAQGEFATFLRADGKDRSELLERMTGTEIYTRLSVAAHLKATLAEQRLRDGRTAALAIAILDCDARAAAEAELALAEAAKVAARARLVEAEVAARWLVESEQRLRMLGAAVVDRDAAKAAAVAGESDRQELRLRQRAEKLRASWEDAARIDRMLALARRDVLAGDAAAKQASEVHAAIAVRRAEMTALHAPIRDARIAAGLVERTASPDGAEDSARASQGDAAWLVERAALAVEVAAWSEVDARFAQHTATGESIAAIDRTLAGHDTTRAALASTRTLAVAEHQTALAKLADAQRKAHGFQQRRGLALDAARRLEDEARTQLAEVERLVAISSGARQAVKARGEIDRQLAELDTAGAADATLARDTEAARALAATLRAERTRVVDELRRAAGYEHARAELRAGDECPLCGATEHPWHGRGAFDGVIATTERDLGEVNARLDAATALLATLGARVQQRARERVRLVSHRATTVATASGAIATWREHLAGLGELMLEDDPSTEAAERLAGEREAAAKKRLEEARDTRRQTEAATKAAAEAQSEVQLFQAHVDQLAMRLVDVGRSLADLEATAERLRGERAGRVERLAELAGSLRTTIAAWFAALPAAEHDGSRDRRRFAASKAIVAPNLDAVSPPRATAASDLERAALRVASATSDRNLAATLARAIVAMKLEGDARRASSSAEGDLREDGRRAGISGSEADTHEGGRVGSSSGGSDEDAGRAGSSSNGDTREDARWAGSSSGGDTREDARRDGVSSSEGVARAGVDRARSAAAGNLGRDRVRVVVIASVELDAARVAMAELAAAWRTRSERVALADAALVAALAGIDEALRDGERFVAEHRARLAAAERRRGELIEELAAAAMRLDAARAASGFDLDELQRLLAADASRIDELAELLAALDRAVERTTAIASERSQLVDDHASARPAALEDAPQVDALAAAVVLADHHAARIAATLAADGDARVRRAAALAMVGEGEQHANVDRILGNVIGSHDGKLFRSFAQSLTLDGLLAVANAHLEELAPRYQLERVPRHDLELQVIDRDLGAEVRSVQSLSGGESFLVSLALALGLSSMSAHDVRVRTLLIDEGFGTLDSATLDSALSVLDALQATGRQVGVISHVPALVERVGAHVRVVQRGGGRSEVIVA